MGEVLMQPMGGGVGSDDVTAAKAQVLIGYNTITKDSDDEVVPGTMPNNAAWSASTSGSGSVTIPEGYHNGSGTVSGAASYNQGVSDADGRVNTSSASYNSGYTNGRQLHWVDLGYGGNGNYNATSVPNYRNLSDTNFVFQVTQANGSGGYNGSGTTGHGFGAGSSCSCYPSVSYNPSNGIATVTGCSDSKSEDHHTTYEYGSKYASVSVSGRLWCVYAG